MKAAIMSSASGAEEGLLADEDLCNSSLLYCAPEAIVLGKWREALEKLHFTGDVDSPHWPVDTCPYCKRTDIPATVMQAHISF